MKRYLQFSIATLCLMIAALIGFHLGNQSAQAQGNMISAFVINGDDHFVMDTNGDVWMSRRSGSTVTSLCGDQASGQGTYCGLSPFYVGNFWGGGPPVPTESETIGGVKGKYK